MLFMLLFFLPGRAAAQHGSNTLSLDIYFPADGTSIEYSFDGNGNRIREFVREWKKMKGHAQVQEIVISSSTSPEGPVAANRRIAEERASHLGRYMAHLMGLQESQFRYDILDYTGEPIPEDQWEQYRHAGIRVVTVCAEEDCQKDASQASNSKLKSDAQPNFEQNRSLQFEGQDNAQSGNIASLTTEVSTLDTAATADATATTDTATSSQNIPQSIKTKKPARPFVIGVKTNLLLDLAMIPAIGIEFSFGNRWSAALNWHYAWWHNDAKAWYWQTYGGDIAVRKYFGKDKGPLTGHHLGIYGQVLSYDFEWGARGFQATPFNYGAGVEYGYAMPIGKHLHLDFSIGVGYLGGPFKEYDPIDGHYVWQATKYLNWFGPTKAEVSLVWMLQFQKKGGKK